jgi:hypothetical protein
MICNDCAANAQTKKGGGFQQAPAHPTSFSRFLPGSVALSKDVIQSCRPLYIVRKKLTCPASSLIFRRIIMRCIGFNTKKLWPPLAVVAIRSAARWANVKRVRNRLLVSPYKWAAFSRPSNSSSLRTSRLVSGHGLHGPPQARFWLAGAEPCRKVHSLSWASSPCASALPTRKPGGRAAPAPPSGGGERSEFAA